VDGSSVDLPFAADNSLASPDGTSFVVTAQKTLADPSDVYTGQTDGTDPGG
jgi:hypothetical protein